LTFFGPFLYQDKKGQKKIEVMRIEVIKKVSYEHFIAATALCFIGIPGQSLPLPKRLWQASPG